jgi:hypothetical protein
MGQQIAEAQENLTKQAKQSSAIPSKQRKNIDEARTADHIHATASRVEPYKSKQSRAIQKQPDQSNTNQQNDNTETPEDR